MLGEAAEELPNLPLVWFNLGEVKRLEGDRSGHAGQELRLATQRWARMNPVTAAHNNRLYHGTIQQIDDLLPTTLVWYVSPCEASSAYGALAKLYPSNKSY